MKIIGVVIVDSLGKCFKGKAPKRHADLIIEMTHFYHKYARIPRVTFYGFYTDDDKILSREEAYILANQNGQAKVNRLSQKLFSEDLW